jgi:hypothetical protein
MKRFDENTYALIEDYLRGKLPSREAEQVGQRIAEDPAFAREVEWMRGFERAMENKAAIRTLNAFHEVYLSRRKAARERKLVAAMSAAAALAALIWVGVHFISTTPLSPNHDEQSAISITAPLAPATWWQAYVQQGPGSATLGPEDDENLRQAQRHLSEGNPEEALIMYERYFSGLMKRGEDDYHSRLEAGKLYLELADEHEKAAGHFRVVANSDAISLYKTDAAYHLAIAEAASGNTEQARRRLSDFLASADIDEYWRSKAEALLSEIEKQSVEVN